MKNWKNWKIVKLIRILYCPHKMWGVKVGEDYLNYTCLHCGVTKQKKRT